METRFQTNAARGVAAPGVSQKTVLAVTRGQKVKTTIQNETETYQAGIAAMLGFTNKAIERMTGLRTHQISYRLTHTGASQARKAYRDGKGEVAEFLMRTARPVAEREFVELMREKLNLQQP